MSQAMNGPTNDDKALALKAQGNQLFRENDFQGACRLWTKAIDDYGGTAQLSTMRVLEGNRAAALLKLDRPIDAMADCMAVLGCMDIDSLTFKAFRRATQASLSAGTVSLDTLVPLINMQKDMARRYQTENPGNTIVWFNAQEEQLLKRFQTSFDSKCEYERLNPPSAGKLTYSYEVIICSQDRQAQGAPARFNETIYYFWHSGPSFKTLPHLTQVIKRQEMAHEKMVKGHEKEVIELLKRDLGDNWGCVGCGRQATLLYPMVLDVLCERDARVENHADSVCEQDGDCWERLSARLKEAEAQAKVKKLMVRGTSLKSLFPHDRA